MERRKGRGEEGREVEKMYSCIAQFLKTAKRECMLGRVKLALHRACRKPQV